MTGGRRNESQVINAAATVYLLVRDINTSYNERSVVYMLNKIWIGILTLKARIKEAIGIKLKPTDDFLIEIRLY